MLISALVDLLCNRHIYGVWQYMLISTLVDQKAVSAVKRVWQYMLISTLVDSDNDVIYFLSDSIC